MFGFANLISLQDVLPPAIKSQLRYAVFKTQGHSLSG